MSESKIRALGVRRFACRTRLAREVLERIATEPNVQHAFAARQALALRAKRCPEW